jgi:hypothetical protein
MAHIIDYKFQLLIFSFKHITKLPLITKLPSLFSIIGYKIPKERQKYQKYSRNMLREAAKMVKEQEVSVYRASKQVGVPWSSLRDFLSKNPQQIQEEADLPKLGRPFTLTADLEVKLQ